MPQEQSCAGVMSSINRNEDIYIRMETKYLGRTALWVVLRLGRMGGTFSSSSQKCHRLIKAPFLSFSFFFVIMGPNGPLLVKRYGSASFEACLFVASGYDSPNPRRNVLRDGHSSFGRHFRSLCFFVHRCVTVRFGVFTLILWFFSKTALARAEFCPLMTGIFNVVDPSRAITLRFTCKPWV